MSNLNKSTDTGLVTLPWTGPKPVAWYDPSDTVTVTEGGSDDVIRLLDKSGGHNLIQPSAANRPTTVNTLNGQTVLTFSGNQWLEYRGAIYPSLILPWIFSVVVPTDDTVLGTIAGTFLSTNANFIGQIEADGTVLGDLFRYYAPESANGASISSSTGFVSGTAYILEAGSDHYASHNIAINGGAYANSTSVSSPLTAQDVIALGMSRDSTPTGAFTGRVGETLFFDRRPTVTQRSLIINYLATKYNIAI